MRGSINMHRWIMSFLFALVVGCDGEFSLTGKDKDTVPVAKPPEKEEDDDGAPPDWQNCLTGFVGSYANLPSDHPDVEPDVDAPAPEGWEELDWFDDVAFQRFDPNLDYGANWWPVDEGLRDDPKYFAVKWNAWMRVFQGTTLEFVTGAGGDLWIDYDGERLLDQPGVQAFSPQTYTVNLGSGQAPMTIHYAHRSGDSGFRFRVLSGNVKICYPEYDLSE